MNHRFSRRSFLQLTGTAGALAALSPVTRAFGVPALLQSGRTITIGMNSWVTSLDAQSQNGPSNIGYRFYGMMHDSLTQVGRDGQPQPLLATEWANDGDRWRFTLRDGVVFHDGTPLTADDVVFSFNRMMSEEYPQNFGNALLRPFIANVEATGDLEVTFTSVQPDPLLPLRLAYHWANIMPRAATEATDFDTLQIAPVGAGPYKVVEFTTDHLVLEAHSEYWGRPAADRIIVRFIPENAIRVGALQSGEVDMIANLPIDQIATINGSSGLKVVTGPLFNHMNVLFNTKTGPTADVNIRRALALAIDRQTIVDELFGGFVRPMTDYLQPGTLGFDESLPVIEYNPDAARAALEAANYDGTPISSRLRRATSIPELLTPVIDAMWQAVGVTTEFEQMEIGAYGQKYLLRRGVTATIQSLGLVR
ncbi:MAG: ABC transporter substrate-binding protein [Chloroflexi bacterium]|nr:ABC transporter substrate-binding protein [Chloroflexota bacterium]